MFTNRGDYYLAGQRASDICKLALSGNAPGRVLDFPSGHGRVLRWLKRDYPDAELHAAEIDPDALEFVERVLGAHPIQSTPNFDTPLPGDLDLIFSGSLLTHLDVWQWDAFLGRCLEALRPGGVLVATFHGRIAGLMARDGHEVFGSLVDTRALYADYARSGFAYRNYDDSCPTYGLTLSSPAWVLGRLDRYPLARVELLREGGWGGYQDVLAISKNDWPMV
jgi:SAM-dependent methyltransferase